MRSLSALTSIAFLTAASAASGQFTVVNPLPADSLQTFYHLPEGGAAMPLDFYRTLAVVDSTTGRLTGQTFDQRMKQYGFLDDPGHDLPVGFGTVELEFLGNLPGLSVNCAACHVGEIHYTGTAGPARLRIIGGPNLADLRRFSQDVYDSILHGLTNPLQLIRLLVRSGRLQPNTVVELAALPLIEVGEFDYIPGGSRAEEFLLAVAELTPVRRGADSPLILFPERQDESVPEIFLVAQRGSRRGGQSRAASTPAAPASPAAIDVARNLALIVAEAEYFLAQGQFPLSTREGYGRLDAFATLRFLLFPRESLRSPFTAPVSVPHLWGTKQKKWLHWNANTNSALQRNIAQSLGMGALAAEAGVNNVLIPNLHPLEQAAEQTTSPKWPADVLGVLNDDLVARGRQLYAARCASCHDAGKVDAASGLVEYPLFALREVRTDPNHALNFHRPVGKKAFPQALAESVQGLQTWYYDRRDPNNPVPVETQTAWAGGQARLPAVWRDPLAQSIDAPVYAALPLNGVWATAPYLHNNSVPTLRDLLKPTAQRPIRFRYGQRDYDPKSVGYLQPPDLNSIPTLERFDTREAGNSNAGHDGPKFGAEGLTADEIEALLEYLKSM